MRLHFALLLSIIVVITTCSSVQASLEGSEKQLKKIWAALADLTRDEGQRSMSSSERQKTIQDIQALIDPDAKSLRQGEDGMQAGTAGYSPPSGDLEKQLEAIANISAVDYADAITREAKEYAGSKSAFYPFAPPSIPLAVKGPYLNTWLPAGSWYQTTPPNVAGNGGLLYGQDPAFWTSSYGADGQFRMAWNGLIRIDNTTHQWMGNAFGTTVAKGPNAKQLSATVTATRSIFEFEADGVKFNATFLTPVEPFDWVRQSLPLSYLHVELDRASAKGRSVQIYTDIDERWITGHDCDYENYPTKMRWNGNNNGSLSYFLERTVPEKYTEFRQRAEWGTTVYATRDRPGLTSRNNNNVVAQFEFLQKGRVSIDHFPVGGPDNAFSFAVDFDNKKGSDDAIFAVGQFRDPLVNYIRAGSAQGSSYLEDRYGLWRTEFDTVDAATAFFVQDFENALKSAKKLDAQIDADARAAVGGGDIGEKYAGIVALSVRQSLATIEITVSRDSKTGKYNSTDTLIFLKEISSNGDMSTVDVIFPQFPLLTYLNPELLRSLLEPIFIYTESGMYPNKWCVHDLGVYPSAFGHNDGNDEPMQVEESGNMILMALHYAQLQGAKKATPWLKQHYSIMQQWAQFLIEDSLIPATQLSTDDFAGELANQTNLALKGISGIAAIGEVATLLGKHSDAKQYQNVSATYIQSFYGFSISKDGSHTKLAYQDDSSWGTLYNLFGDRLLNLQLVSREIYDIQDSWYPKKAARYAVPLDSRHGWAKTDWELFTSAISASNATRNLFIEKVYDFASNGRTDAPFTDLMHSITGDFPKEPYDPLKLFLARPVVGGHLFHMALAKADKVNGISASRPYKYGPPIKSKKPPSKERLDEIAGIIARAKQGALGGITTPSGFRQGGNTPPKAQKADASSSKSAGATSTKLKKHVTRTAHEESHHTAAYHATDRTAARHAAMRGGQAAFGAMRA
ncbi:hypothetical protein CBOM_05493 [Ceraceosorus bombacis]|uniref:Glutaminase A n=1 Tax=Ceraceosorus bombacis TaxID=401625 RepID=A0A0P1BRJ0_9BASI|nr:hypothetical protein CBOM_05493 [Ceraceosorus bombacis]